MLTDKNKLPVLNLKLLNVKLPSISPRLLHHFSSDFFQKSTEGGVKVWAATHRDHLSMRQTSALLRPVSKYPSYLSCCMWRTELKTYVETF